MNRRDIFKLIGGALCAASIELTGRVPRMPKSLDLRLWGYEFTSIIFERSYKSGEDGIWRRIEPTLPADG